MGVETQVEQAVERVERETEHMRGRHRAVERFADRVADVRPAADGAGRPATDGGVVLSPGMGGASTREGGCAEVRECFAETVAPYSTADLDGSEPLVETISEEFNEAVALALSPATGADFSPATKRAVITAAEERGREIKAMLAALDRERESLAEAAETVGEITAWLTEANEQPLLELGFEELIDRHRRIDSFRASCDDLARDRQRTLRTTTAEQGSAAIEHEQLLALLYDEFPTEFPVLTTVARLGSLFEQSQRALRDHLVRRV